SAGGRTDVGRAERQRYKAGFRFLQRFDQLPQRQHGAAGIAARIADGPAATEAANPVADVAEVLKQPGFKLPVRFLRGVHKSPRDRRWPRVHAMIVRSKPDAAPPGAL